MNTIIKFNQYITEITKANYEYWNLNSNTLTYSDKEYDILVKEFIDTFGIEYEYLIRPNRSFIYGQEIKHSKQMLSLDKVFSNEEVYKWCDKVKRNNDELFLVQIKLDGMSARLNHKNKTLYTNGDDGISGIDISNKLNGLNIISNGVISDEKDGELLIPYSIFNKYNSELFQDKHYKHPRGMVVGLSRKKDLTPPLTFVDYNFVSVQIKYSEIKNKFSKIVDELLQKFNDYPNDGVVIKLADENYQQTLGNNEKFPYWALALKFYDELYESKLTNIIFQKGKHKVTPVAIFTPIKMNDGSTVEKSTLHNYKTILDKDLQINDDIIVCKRGKIIPYFVSNSHNNQSVKLIDIICPECDSILEYKNPELYCNNKDCDAGIINKLIYNAKSLDIVNIGDSNARQLVEILGVRNIKDLFDTKLEDILLLEGFKDKSANKLFDSINKAKSNFTELQLLSCLNIKSIGTRVFKPVLNNFKNLSELVKFIKETDNISIILILSTIKGIDKERSKIILKEIKNNLIFIESLIPYLKKESIITTNNKKICFTGNNFNKSRNELKQIAELNNLEVIDSVTKELTYLVSSDETSSKTIKAKKYNVEVLSEIEFLTMFLYIFDIINQ